MFTNKF